MKKYYNSVSALLMVCRLCFLMCAHSERWLVGGIGDGLGGFVRSSCDGVAAGFYIVCRFNFTLYLYT